LRIKSGKGYPEVIVIMGIAGSGKGTQGKQLSERYKLKYLSTGEILREHATPAISEKLQSGKLLDDQEIIELVNSQISLSTDPSLTLLDGFPRSIPQAEWLYRQYQSGRIKLPIIIKLNVSQDEAKRRLLLRGRGDDVPDTIEQRFQEYHDSTLPILTYFSKNNFPVIEIDATQPADVVYNLIVTKLRESSYGTGSANQS